MTYKKITDQPYRSMVNEEWRRAVKLLNPLLAKEKKPVLLWWKKKGMHGVLGKCYGKNFCSMVKLGHWRVTPIIIIAERRMKRDGEKGFRHLLRHEIIHLLEKNHNDRFRSLASCLGTGRWYSLE